MEANALHIWPRGGYMMIALPNADGTYTCTLFWPLDGPVSFASVDSPGQIEGLFQREFPDVPALIPDLVEQYQTNPVGSLVTIRCSPWNYGERTLLIGDAAHAVVPFYGQGMNASFEDCRLLREAMREAPTPSAAFERFAAERPEDTDALADLAIDNYVTMRDRVASKAFLVRRTIGRLAHRILPSVFVPLYTLVTFTSLPYAEAAARWDRQARMARIAGVLLVSLALFVLLVSRRGQ
jgi:kynurenine 3-monooxygenase